MKTLIAEDDFTSQLLLRELLKGYGPCDVAVNGYEAVMAAGTGLVSAEPYDLICLDIMMSEMDGRAALNQIRGQEETCGILSSNGANIGDDHHLERREEHRRQLLRPMRRLPGEAHRQGLTPADAALPWLDRVTAGLDGLHRSTR